MPKYKEILRLSSLGISQREIAKTVKSSRDTVKKVINIAKAQNVGIANIDKLSNEQLDELFGFQKGRNSRRETIYEMPDYEALSKELKKPGVTMNMLWEEY